MKTLFEVASGTIIGKEHLLANKNNQDAYHWLSTKRAIVAVVCDGCSSGKNSEVGAKIGAQLITKKILCNIEKLADSEHIQTMLFWEKLRYDILFQLQSLSETMGNSMSQIITNYFLFTVVGVIITPSAALIFSFGDGLFIINDELVQFGPFPNNEPPYLTYGITGSSLTEKHPELLKFKLQRTIPTEKIESLLIGTDGVIDLIKQAKNFMPGKKESVGSISQFWQNDIYFKNPDMIRRKLTIINRESTKIDWIKCRIVKKRGLLPDDTTLIVIRRKPKKEIEK